MDAVVEDPDLTKDVIRLLGQELKTVRGQLQEAQRSLSARSDTVVPASNDAVELVQAENTALKGRISVLEHELAAFEDVKPVKLEPSSMIKLEGLHIKLEALHHEESEGMGATNAELEKTQDKYERLKQAHRELTETLAATETMLKEATTAKERALQDLEALQKQPVKMTPRCDESIHAGPESLPAFADPRPFTRAEAVALPEPDSQQISEKTASTAVFAAQERAAAAEVPVAVLKGEVKALHVEDAKLRQQEVQSDSSILDLEFPALLTEEEADQEKCKAKIMNPQERLAEIENPEKRKVLKSHQLATSDAASAGSSKGASGIAQADKPMDMDVIQVCHQRDSKGNYYNRRTLLRSLPRPLSSCDHNSFGFPSSMDEAAIHSFLKDYCQKRDLDGTILSGAHSLSKFGHGFLMVPMNGANNPPKDGDVNAKVRLSFDSAEGRTLEVFVWHPNTRKVSYLGKVTCFKMPPLTIEEIEDLKQRDWNMLLKLMQRSFDLPQIQAAKDDRATGCQAGKIIIYCLGLQRISFNHDFYNGLLKDLATLGEDSTNKRKHEENVGNQTKRAKFSESGGTWC